MKILVVDDERDVQILFEQRFRKEIRNGDITFVFAFSGEEAVQTLDALDQEAVLILSDINMPGMSGLDLLDHIKKTYIKPPPVVMMITAYGDEEEDRGYLVHGVRAAERRRAAGTRSERTGEDAIPQRSIWPGILPCRRRILVGRQIGHEDEPRRSGCERDIVAGGCVFVWVDCC